MVANEVAAGTADYLPDFNNVRSSMCRQRSCSIPPIPCLVSDVDIRDSWAETWNNANFVIEQRVNNNPVNAIIYGTDNDMFALSECEKIYVDGTFKSTPRSFKQIFTVHGMYFDHTIHFATWH